MTWDSTDISDRHDAGTSGYDADGFGTADGPGEPGPGGSGRGTWAGIGIALALIGAIAATVVVWLAHVQAGAQGPQVTYAGARGVPTASAAGADAAGAGGTSSAAGGDAAGAGGTSGAASGADGTSSGSSSPLNQVDQAWAARAATATGISDRAFLAYASADLTIGKEQPGCGLGWNTLAAIGTVESANGTYGRATVLPDGYTSKPITGVPLDGGTFGGSTLAAIPASGNGTSSGWARAEGPFQFLPSTWARWGADGNGDGTASPNQIDDAALTAARYLCASGPMATAAGWRAAVFAYNHSNAYVNEVADIANRYAAETSGL